MKGVREGMHVHPHTVAGDFAEDAASLLVFFLLGQAIEGMCVCV